MAARKSGLGKGLDSLISDKVSHKPSSTSEKKEKATASEKEKAEKIETAKQHKAIDDNVDNTAVTLNDNQSDDSNN